MLDTLLADGSFSVNAVSVTSAGALNAAALVQGLAQGGPEGARQRLELLWKEVGRRSPLRATYWFIPGSAQPFFGPVLRASLEAIQLFNSLVSPYQTGLPAPNLFEGIIVQVTPFVRDGLPRGVSDIMNRVNEITFNASFVWELAGICERQGYLQRQAATDTPTLQRPSGPRLHFLPVSAEFGRDEMASKVDTRPTYLDSLRRTGRQDCLNWQASGGADDAGKRSCLDLGALLNPARPG